MSAGVPIEAEAAARDMANRPGIACRPADATVNRDSNNNLPRHPEPMGGAAYRRWMR